MREVPISRPRRSTISFHRRSDITLYLGVPLLLAAALLQSTLFLRLRPGGAVPNLVMILVLAWSLLRGTREGFVWAFAGGLALDLFSSGAFGLSSIALLLICALAGLTEGHVQSHSLLLALATIALSTVAFDAVHLLGAALGGRAPDSFETLARVTLSGALLNAVVMLPAHWLLARLYHATELSEVRLR